jgi:hypothetical protein
MKCSREHLIIIYTYRSRSRIAIKCSKRRGKSANLGKPDGPVSQTGTSSFGRTKSTLAEEGDCSTSSSDVDDDDDDDDDTDDECDYQELLLEF